MALVPLMTDGRLTPDSLWDALNAISQDSLETSLDEIQAHREEMLKHEVSAQFVAVLDGLAALRADLAEANHELAAPEREAHILRDYEREIDRLRADLAAAEQERDEEAEQSRRHAEGWRMADSNLARVQRHLQHSTGRVRLFEAALTALRDSFTACTQDPAVPCPETGEGELLYPDDWCLACYMQRVVTEALAGPASRAQP
jgi:hypothetical protein